MAAFCTVMFGGLALLIGWLLRISPLFRWWTSTSLWAGLLAGASLFILVFGYSLGITAIGHGETGAEFVMLHPLAALAGYFGLLFSIAHWPASMRVRRSDIEHATAEPHAAVRN